MKPPISGHTPVAAVVGAPVTHSLSPAIHNAWLAAASLDGVYIALQPAPARFEALVEGLRGSLRGLNVTAPFKERALAAADSASPAALAAGAANLLVFEPDGAVRADNTDGIGLLAAFAEQAPAFDPAAGPSLILGAGGAARGAAAAFLAAGAVEVRLVSRDGDRAAALAAELGPRVRGFGPNEGAAAGVATVINATSADPAAAAALLGWIAEAPRAAVIMDMSYGARASGLLAAAAARGHATVDGLAMLIGQARPSFTAMFGRPPPPIDIRADIEAAKEEPA